MDTPSAPLKSKLREYWGLFLAEQVVGFAIIHAVIQDVPGHFRTFTQAARALWQGLPTFGTPFVGNLFFYSPSCALFLFGPFTLLPEKLGLVLYLAGSSAVLIYGIVRFAKHFVSMKDLNWFWVLLAQPLYSSIDAHKPEVLSLGLLLLCGAWMIEGVRLLVVPVLCAMVANWKLQPFPSVALLGLGQMLYSRDWKWSLRTAGWVGFWFGVPFVFLPWQFLWSQHGVWRNTLHQFTSVAYIEFDNIYSFLQNFCGIHLTFPQSQVFSGVAAGACAGVLGCWIWVVANNLKLKDIVLVALALGAGYTALFSPLQQVQAYILLVPAYFLGYVRWNQSQGRKRLFWAMVLGSLFLIMSFAYSDLVPEGLRLQLRHMTVRSGAILFYMAILIGDLLVQLRSKVARDQPALS